MGATSPVVSQYLQSRIADLPRSNDQGAARAVGERIVSVDLFLKNPDGTFPKITSELLTNARVKAFASYAEKLADPKIKHGIVVMGMPCSGKSRLVAELAAKHLDTAFFEATLSTHQERISLMDAANGSGKPVHCIYVHQDHKVIHSRNRQRSGNRRLPEEALVGMMRRLAEMPPSLAEGFASITRYSTLTRLEQTTQKLNDTFGSRFDVSRMAYHSPVDFTIRHAEQASLANPIPLIDTLLKLLPTMKIGFMHGNYHWAHNGHLASFREAIRAEGPDGQPLIDVLVVEPAFDHPDKPWVAKEYWSHIEILRRAIAYDAELRGRVVVTDVQGRVKGYPKRPDLATIHKVDCYGRMDIPGQFTFVQGADCVGDEHWKEFGPKSARPHVSIMVTGRAGYDTSETERFSHITAGEAERVQISSTEIRDALKSGDLSSIKDRVPQTTYEALKGALAIKNVPLLQNFIKTS